MERSANTNGKGSSDPFPFGGDMEVKIIPDSKVRVLRLIDGLVPERMTLTAEQIFRLNKNDILELEPAPDTDAKRQLSFNYG